MLTQEKVIEQFKEKNGNKFDYSKVEYYPGVPKVLIICKKHGEFLCSPANHKKGRGCPKCRTDLLIERNKIYIPSIDTIIGRFKKAHGTKYDYSKFKYIDCKTPSIIIFFLIEIRYDENVEERLNSFLKESNHE